MQLIDICTNVIALFAGLYLLTAIAAHLVHCWQNPPIKTAAAELPLLLPPTVKSHPFESSLERMPEIKPIFALHQPAASVEPSADALDVEPTIAADDLSGLTIRELKALASDRQIRGTGKRTKSELIELLTV